MSESIAEQIARLIHADLVGNTSAGAAVERDRETAIGRDEGLVVLVELGDEETQPLGGVQAPIATLRTERNDLRLMVTVLTRGASWQTQADAVRVQAHQRILQLQALRPLVSQVRRERAEWRPANAEMPVGYLCQTYLITYAANAFTLGPVA